MYKTKYPLLIDYLRDEIDCILPVDEIIEIENLIDEDLNKRSEQLNLEKLDKAFNSILKGYDKDKLQDWIDGKV